jgi:PAS domain-containing protein
MKQNNHFIWYIPFYFLLFLTFYIGIKFIFIFIFMTSYFPSFIFDLTPLYYFSGFELTHLLFLSFIVLLVDIYLHIALSKKHLLFSFIPTGILIAGIGFRIAMYPFSMEMSMHYILFTVLLVVLIIDHRLYLLIPETFSHLSVLEHETLKPLPLPAFSSTKPSPIQTVKKGGMPNQFLSSFKDSFRSVQDSFQKRIHGLLPKAISDQGTNIQSTEHIDKIDISDTFIDKTSHIFKHPIEKQIDLIKTTKQLLGSIGHYSDHLKHLDRHIQKTKYSEKTITDFIQSINQELPESQSLEPDQYDTLLKSVPESAVIVSRGIVKGVNHLFIDLIGKPAVDIIDHNFIDFIAPEGLQKYKLHCLQRLGGESSISFPIVLKTKKNEKMTKQVKINKIYPNDEEIEMLIFQEIAT